MNPLNRIAPDKARHYIAGSALAALGGLHSVAVGAAVCIAFAIGKEVRDRVTSKGNPEPLDAIWTIVGGAVALLPLAAWRIGEAL